MLVPLHQRVLILFRAHKGALAALVTSVSAFIVLLVLKRGVSDVSDLIGSAVLIVSSVGALILTSTVVSGDFRTGAVMLWLQKPLSPVRFYLGRWMDAGVAWISLSVGFVVFVHVLTVAIGLDAESNLLMALPVTLLTCGVVASIAFGVSPWLFRGGSLVTVVVWISGAFLNDRIPAVLGGSHGGVSWYGVFASPYHALFQVREVVRGNSEVLIPSLIWITAYCLMWVGIGILGVVRAENGGLARA